MNMMELIYDFPRHLASGVYIDDRGDLMTTVLFWSLV